MPTVAPGLQRKLSKVLHQQRTDSPEVSKDLAALSTVYKENSAYNRRNIRSIIENGLLESNNRFVEDAKEIMSSIEAVQEDLATLGQLCDKMSSILSQGQTDCSKVLGEIDHLKESITLAESRKEWLELFQEKYQVPKECILVLKEGVINEAFFDALRRVQVVHGNCRSLGLSYHHKAGLELLDELSALQDEAFKHVCSWIQAECQAIESPENPEIGDMMPKAMKCLRTRPPLYSYCAEEIAMSRRTAVFQKFIQALSQGSRPIEMHAADPWRYANDMLAWIHAAIASEMELLGTLFEGCYSSSGIVMRTASLNAQIENTSAEDDSFLSLQEIMDTIFESICRPLKLRLEQILMSAPSPVLNFQLTTLFGFYLHTIGPVMGEQSKLSHTLQSCRSSAEKSLSDQMKQRGERLVRQPPIPPGDLSMPEAYIDRLGIAISIIKFYESSLLANDDKSSSGEENTDGDLAPLLSTILDPIVDSVYSGADALNPASSVRLDERSEDMNPSRQFMYILNCLCHMKMQLDVFDSAAALIASLQKKIDETTNRLVLLRVQHVLKDTQLRPQTDIESSQETESEELSPDTSATGATALWSKLQDPLLTAYPAEYSSIMDASVRKTIENRIISNIIDTYTIAYHRASRSANISSLHPPEDVKTLLGT
jgi:hypothetical protein